MIPIPDDYQGTEWHGYLAYHHADIQPVMLRSLKVSTIFAVFCPECGHLERGESPELVAAIWNDRVSDEGGGPPDDDDDEI